MKFHLTKSRILSVLVFAPISFLYAQTSLKFESKGGSSGSGPTGDAQVVTMHTGDGAVYSPTIKVNFEFKNQQFSSVEGNSGTKGILFGGGTEENSNIVSKQRLYNTLNSIGNSRSTEYATNGATPLINVSHDYGVYMMTVSDALINSRSASTYPINKDVYYGDMTVTFSRPVTNPVLHFTGLGGYHGYYLGKNGASPYKFYVLGYSAQFELIGSSHTLSRLNGSKYFEVSGKQIRNSAKLIGDNTQGGTVTIDEHTVKNVIRHAASGSVLVNGSNITALTFKIYMHPDGGMTTYADGRTTSGDDGRMPRWSTGASDPDDVKALFSGDNFLVSASLIVYPIKGTVFDDNNAGVPDGRPYKGAAVKLHDQAGNIVATTTTDAYGKYAFEDVFPGDYNVVLTTPDGYRNVGSSEGDKDGNTAVTVTNTLVNGVDFGINEPPVAKDDEKGEQPSGVPTTVDILENDSDPNGGTLSPGKISLIPGENANDVITDKANNVTGFTIPGEGSWMLNSDGSVTFTPEEKFRTSPTPIQYTVTDEAGLASNPAWITIIQTSLPVRLISFNAQTSDCAVVLSWATTYEDNFGRFEVERSSNGRGFSKIGTVLPGNGSYGFTDFSAAKGNNYYRLRIVDLNGSFEYSPLVNGVFTCERPGAVIYPNPAENLITVSAITAGMLIEIIDPSGRRLWSFRADGNSRSIDVSWLSAGVYTLVVKEESGAVISRGKLIKK